MLGDTSQFFRIQKLVSETPSILHGLLWRYRTIVGPYFTRDLRLILDQCIGPEVLLLLYDVDIHSEENKVLLLQPKTGMQAFINDFVTRVVAYFDDEKQAALMRCLGGSGDSAMLAVEDRAICFWRDFDKFKADNGYAFLLAVRQILDYEAQLLQSATRPPPTHEIVLLKRQLTNTVSEKSLILTDFKKRCIDASSLDCFKKMQVALQGFDSDNFLANSESLKPAFKLLEDLAKQLTTAFKRSLVNDRIQRFDLESFNGGVELDRISRASIHLDLVDEFSAKIDSLFIKSLLVLSQEFQVIREKKHLTFELQLLFGDFYSKFYHFEFLDLKIALLNEEKVKKLEERPSTLGLEQLNSLAEKSNITVRDKGRLKLTRDSEFVSEISLQVTSLPKRDNPVWAQKFVFCFFAIQGSRFVHCLSRLVTFITNDNQRMDSTACIAYENEFPMPLRSGFEVLNLVDESKCVDMIDRYFFDVTNHGLSFENRSYFSEKCQELMAKSKKNHITFEDLIRVPFIGTDPARLRTLWDFVYTCVKFIKDRAQKLWVSNLIYGFISKAEAVSKIRKLVETHTLPDRGDFALLRFSETTATVTVCYSTTDGCDHGITKIQNLTPKPESHFTSVPVSKFCDDPLSPLTQILTCGGALQKSAVLREMIPKEDNVPGYVPLRKVGDASSDVLSDLASSIASVSVLSPVSEASYVRFASSPDHQMSRSEVLPSRRESDMPNEVLGLVFDYDQQKGTS